MEQTIDKTVSGMPDQMKYAIGGATAALILALFTPVVLLLGLEAGAAVAGYLYCRNKKNKKASGAVVDVTPVEEEKGN